MGLRSSEALSDTRVIAFDAPGTGRSMTTCLPLTLELLSEMAEGLLDRLGYERVDVLGYSFGGLVAQFLAWRAPERVRRLVLAATTPGWGGMPGSTWALQQMSTPLRYYWQPYYQSVIGASDGRPRPHRSRVRPAPWRPPNAQPADPARLPVAADGAPRCSGSLSWLSRLTAQTLVIAGDDDPVMPLANALLLARHIPAARLFVASGEGHLLMMDGSSQALPVIRSFLAADDLRRSAGWQQASVVTEAMLAAALRREPGGSPTRWR